MCPGDGNGSKLTGHHIHARRLLHYIHGRCFRFRQAGRQSPERAIYRAARKPCWPPSSSSSLGLFPSLLSSPPLDKLVFWNDRRLFWAWQTMRRGRSGSCSCSSPYMGIHLYSPLPICLSLQVWNSVGEHCISAAARRQVAASQE